LIGKIEDVISLVKALCASEIDWEEASKRLPVYDGDQDIE